MLKFLTSLYWLGEYEQPVAGWSSLAGRVGVEEVLQLADHEQGQACPFHRDRTEL